MTKKNVHRTFSAKVSRNDFFAETKAAATRCLATCHTAMPERQGAVTPTNTKRSVVGGRFFIKTVWIHSSVATRLPTWKQESNSVCVLCSDQITEDQIRTVLLWTERSESIRFISRCCRTSRSSEVPVVMQDPEAVPRSIISYVWICLLLLSNKVYQNVQFRLLNEGQANHGQPKFKLLNVIAKER